MPSFILQRNKKKAIATQQQPFLSIFLFVAEISF